ncbi:MULTISPECIES: hypothetical protein [Cyanophyceae]|uniref:hypothetical protein n=1 Tax=Cyanophyceae TaxID=3028117 RepID=UPI0002A66067|nr:MULTISPECIES: hypothetical protein [Cyanophyceae]AFZ33586.1 hypothetical protein Glo7428_5208 [Gloeocapsa sp. PCC 7428]PPS42088.1 hypothetical protein B1A85_16660 [Chroococcidiopsis sp. TS-821]
MSTKVAVAIIHGIGTANPKFAEENDPEMFTSGMAKKLKYRFSTLVGEKPEDADSKLAIKAVYWALVLQDLQDKLYRDLRIDRLNDFWGLRYFVFHSLADSIGYQITSSAPNSERDIYDGVHKCFAATLAELAQPDNAGSKAPLCIIGHSLGSVIASNYIWDLQKKKAKIEIGSTPLEQGETLTLFYTFGSQIALWGLRHNDFGTPIKLPPPQLSQHYPNLGSEWLNFYDRDDVLGYPLKAMNEQYRDVVTSTLAISSNRAQKGIG